MNWTRPGRWVTRGHSLFLYSEDRRIEQRTDKKNRRIHRTLGTKSGRRRGEGDLDGEGDAEEGTGTGQGRDGTVEHGQRATGTTVTEPRNGGKRGEDRGVEEECGGTGGEAEGGGEEGEGGREEDAPGTATVAGLEG